MKTSKLVSLLLTFAMLLSLVVIPVGATDNSDKDNNTSVSTTSTFPDVTDHWGKTSIERWAGYSVLNGDDKGNFNPDDPMTRAEFSTMLVNLMGYTAKAENSFADVDTSAWYANAILKLAAAGIMKGDGTNANPNAYISRQEAAVLLCRVFGITPNGSSVSFADKGSIASWAMDSVVALSERNMIAGMGGNLFAPLDNINRASVAKMIDNMITTYVASGSVTVDKTTDGIVLVAGGNVTVKEDVTVARLVVAPKASGSTVTVEKKATVTSMEIAGRNVTVDGAGTVKTLTVTGSGATIDKNTTVEKLVNNGTGSVTYGDKTIKAGETYTNGKTETPSGGSSGGGRGPSGGGTTANEKDIATAADLMEKINSNTKDATINATMAAGTEENLGNITIENNKVTTLTVDLQSFQAENVVINSTSATSITLNGVADKAQITNLTINTPKADFYNNVEVTGTVTIEAVKDSSYHAKAATGAIVMEGPGKVEVDGTATVSSITVNTDQKVTMAGNITAVNSQNANANLTLSTNAAGVTLSGAAKQVNTSSNITLNNATVGTIAVSGGTSAAPVAVAASGNSNIENLQVNTPNAQLNTSANTVTMGSNANTITLGDGVAVGTLVTTGNTLTINTADDATNQPVVSSVDFQSNAAAPTLTLPTNLTVNQITTTTGNTVDATVDGVKNESIPQFAKSAPPAGKFNPVMPTTLENTDGKIAGLTVGLQYKLKGDQEWTTVTEETAGTVENLVAGTYLVRTAEKKDGNVTFLASEPIEVVVPAAVAVKTAQINGSAIVGQTLTATANSDATDTLHYTWKYGTTAIENNDKATLKVDDAHVGKTITVTIHNYTDEGKTSVATAVVTADTSALTAAIAKANNLTVGVLVKDDGTKATNVSKGIMFVEKTKAEALETALTNAEAAVKDPIKTEKVKELLEALNDAMNSYKPVAGEKNLEVAALKEELNELLASAAAMMEVSTSAQGGIDIAPSEKWVPASVKTDLGEAGDAAYALVEDQQATTAKLSEAITTLTEAMANFQKAMQNGATIDTTALVKAITNAEVKLDGVKPSDSDGSDILPTEFWATTADRGTYNNAIEAAKGAVASADTQKAVNEALNTLNEATATFNSKVSAGKKDMVAPIVTAVVSERGSTTATVTITSNEAASYKYTVNGTELTGSLTAGEATNIELTGLTAEASSITIEVTDAAKNATTVMVTIPAFDSGKVSFAAMNADELKAFADWQGLPSLGKVKVELTPSTAANTFNAAGTLFQVKDFVGFNTEVVAQQSGYYAALKLTGIPAGVSQDAVIIRFGSDSADMKAVKAANLDAEGTELYTIIYIADLQAASTNKKVDFYVNWNGLDADNTDATHYVVDFSGVTLNTAATHTVTVVVDDATTPNTVVDGAKFTKPADPTKEGYTFDKWVTKSGEQETAYNFETPVTADVTLYATWTPLDYTITYVLDGGTNFADAPEKYTIETDTISLGMPTKDNFTFAGWYTDAAMTEANKITEIKKGTTGNLILHAKWTTVETPDPASVSFAPMDTAGYNLFSSWAGLPTLDKMTLDSIKADQTDSSKYAVTGTLKPVTGFTGFNTEEVAQQSGYYAALTLTDISVSADLADDATVVMFGSDENNLKAVKKTDLDGANKDSLNTIIYIAALTEQSTNKTVHFYVNGNGFTDKADATHYTMDFKAVTLTPVIDNVKVAIATAENYATVVPEAYRNEYPTVDENSGLPWLVVTYTKNITDSAVLTYKKDSTEGTFVKGLNLANDSKSDNVGADKIGDGYVMYELKNDLGIADNQSGAYEVTLSLNGVQKTENTNYNPAAPTPEKYTVTFNTNGGTGTAEVQEVETGKTVTQPTNITKTGYNLEGWYSKADFTGDKWVFGEGGTAVTEPITLYAKWTSAATFEAMSSSDATTAFPADPWGSNVPDVSKTTLTLTPDTTTPTTINASGSLYKVNQWTEFNTNVADDQQSGYYAMFKLTGIPDNLTTEDPIIKFGSDDNKLAGVKASNLDNGEACVVLFIAKEGSKANKTVNFYVNWAGMAEGTTGATKYSVVFGDDVALVDLSQKSATYPHNMDVEVTSVKNDGKTVNIALTGNVDNGFSDSDNETMLNFKTVTDQLTEKQLTWSWVTLKILPVTNSEIQVVETNPILEYYNYDKEGTSDEIQQTGEQWVKTSTWSSDAEKFLCVAILGNGTSSASDKLADTSNITVKVGDITYNIDVTGLTISAPETNG